MFFQGGGGYVWNSHDGEHLGLKLPPVFSIRTGLLSLKKGPFLKGNESSEPTMDFQGIFVSFQGSIYFNFCFGDLSTYTPED